MTNLILPKNHISIESIPDVTNIVEPFLKSYEITGFVYGRIYDDGTYYILINTYDYYMHHLKNEYMVAPPVLPSLLNKKFFYLAYPEGRYQQVIHDMRSYFDSDYPFYLIERFDDGFEMFGFTAPINNDQIINFYLNNTDLIEKFSFYFKEKAAKLMKNSEKSKLILTPKMCPTFQGISKNPLPDNSKKQLFMKEFISKLFSLTGRPIKFSKREMECLKCLSMGRTAKETANIVGLSQRTIEYYINNIKHKVGCRSKSKLIDFIIDNELFK